MYSPTSYILFQLLHFQWCIYTEHSCFSLSYFLNKYLFGISYVPSTILNASRILSHLIFITTFGKRYYYYPSIDDKTEVSRSNIPKLRNVWLINLMIIIYKVCDTSIILQWNIAHKSLFKSFHLSFSHYLQYLYPDPQIKYRVLTNLFDNVYRE